MLFPFLPEAVQTERQGELCVRQQVCVSDFPSLRAAARRLKIVYRTVMVTAGPERSHYWVFSKIPIPTPYGQYRHPPTPSRERKMVD